MAAPTVPIADASSGAMASVRMPAVSVKPARTTPPAASRARPRGVTLATFFFLLGRPALPWCTGYRFLPVPTHVPGGLLLVAGGRSRARGSRLRTQKPVGQPVLGGTSIEGLERSHFKHSGLRHSCPVRLGKPGRVGLRWRQNRQFESGVLRYRKAATCGDVNNARIALDLSVVVVEVKPGSESPLTMVMNATFGVRQQVITRIPRPMTARHVVKRITKCHHLFCGVRHVHLSELSSNARR